MLIVFLDIPIQGKCSVQAILIIASDLADYPLSQQATLAFDSFSKFFVIVENMEKKLAFLLSRLK